MSIDSLAHTDSLELLAAFESAAAIAQAEWTQEKSLEEAFHAAASLYTIETLFANLKK
jgi:hypothetical protein